MYHPIIIYKYNDQVKLVWNIDEQFENEGRYHYFCNNNSKPTPDAAVDHISYNIEEIILTETLKNETCLYPISEHLNFNALENPNTRGLVVSSYIIIMVHLLKLQKIE